MKGDEVIFKPWDASAIDTNPVSTPDGCSLPRRNLWQGWKGSTFSMYNALLLPWVCGIKSRASERTMAAHAEKMKNNHELEGQTNPEATHRDGTCASVTRPDQAPYQTMAMDWSYRFSP
jgi:hypothetical protein